MHLLLLSFLIPTCAWGSSTPPSWTDSGLYRTTSSDYGLYSSTFPEHPCTEREGTSFTLIRSQYLYYWEYIDATQKLLNRVYDRFPCVTRQYSEIQVSDSAVSENVYTNKDDFINNMYNYYWDWSYYYSCNEPLLYGLKRALEVSPAGSFILVLSSGSMADSNDVELLNEVYSLLEEKQSQVFFMVYGYCYVDDLQRSIFNEIASRSFGQFLELGNLNQAIYGLDLLLTKPVNSSLRILNVSLDLYGEVHEEFNVTTTLTYLLITTRGDMKLNLTGPTGNNIEFEEVQSYIAGSSYLVKSPDLGTWFLDYFSNGLTSIKILGFTDTEIKGECISSECHPNASCEEFGGSQQCTCKEGFTGDGSVCYDVNECYDYWLNLCDYGYCENSIGSFSCICYSGFVYSEGSGCVDIDECASPELNTCHALAVCSNDYGWYSCYCPYGYFGDGTYCEINECQQGTPCGSESECTKVYGSYSCSDPCSNYTVLNDQWRSTANIHDWNDYYYDYSWLHCDYDLNGWYRFMGAENLQIPEYCVPQLSCGTHAPMWLDGRHPTREEGIVTYTACANWATSCCLWSTPISVKACPSGYYVYKLTGTPTCYLAYCVDSNFTCSGTNCALDEECIDINGVSECQCKNNPNINSDLESNGPEKYISVECGLSQVKLTFSKCQFERMGYDTSSIHLRNNSCTSFIERGDKSVVTIITLPKSGYCGAELEANETHLTYINTMYLALKSDGIIQRGEKQVNFYCAFPRNMEVTLLTAINPLVNTTVVTVGGTGTYSASMGLFQDSDYTTLYEGSEVWLTTESILYVGVTVEQTKESNFALLMKNCYATPTSDRGDPVKYYIIKDRCPNRNDPTINVTTNGGSLAGRFSIQAFKFIGNFPQVYLHCEIRLCDTSHETCTPYCYGMRSASVDTGSATQTLSVGPIRKAASSASCSVRAMSLAALISNVLFAIMIR